MGKRKKNDSIVAVGLLARDLKAQYRMDALKYEGAIYKVLAIVGAIAQKHNLPSTLTANIGVLLPWGEYRSRQWLTELLSKALKSFYFRGQHLKVEVKHISCLPEGFGGLQLRVSEQGESWLQNRKVAVLMFGHRNTSYLWLERGGLREGKTTELGFHQLIQKIVERTPGQYDVDFLTSIVYRLGKNIIPENKLLHTLLQSTQDKNRNREIVQITRVIRSARQEYWSLLKNWLDSVIPSSVHEVICLGGVAQYLRPEIEQQFAWTSLYWADEIIPQIKKLHLPVPLDQQQDLAYRLVDVYGYSNYMSGKRWEKI